MTAATNDTICEAIGIRGMDGVLRPPFYDRHRDTPETIGDVRAVIAKGAYYGCWAPEPVK